jgi:hypothetical protein
VAHDHQPVDLGAVGWVELVERRFGTADDLHFRPENLALDALVGDLSVLRVHHGYGHLAVPG